MTIEITDGNIARLEHAHRILCPYCGSVAAVVDVPEYDEYAAEREEAYPVDVKGPTPTIPPIPPEIRGIPTNSILVAEPERQRGPRRSRATLKTEIVAFLAENPTATKEEVRKSVGGRSATVHSIVDEINTAPPAAPPVKGPLQALWDVAEIVRQYASV